MAVPKKKTSARTKAAPAEPAAAQKRRRSKAALVQKAIENIEEKLESNEVKASYGDFIRLLQLEQEIKQEHEKQPREIKVTWVEPDEQDRASEK